MVAINILPLQNTSVTGNGTDSFLRIEKVELTGGIGNNTLNASAFTFSFYLSQK